MPKRRIPSNRFTARQVIDVLQEAGGVIDWRGLVDALDAALPAEITQLRKLLKGLERNDEIYRDHKGSYYLPDSGGVEEAIIEARGRELCVGMLVIDDPQRSGFRPGDRVSYRVVGDQARVVDILEFSDAPVFGVLNWRGRYPYVEAMGVYRGRVTLVDPPAAGTHGDTVEVRIVDRDRRGLVGIVEAVLDAPHVLDQAIETAVASGGIPHEWPSAVTAAVEKLPKRVQKSRQKNRVDLTDLALVTIDGETAQDFDDAVYAEKRKGAGGGWRLVVAIADVAHYVKPDGALDTEAVERGTSVYFPERVIPMLPEALSNGLCSLRPRVERLSLVCDMRISSAGQIKSHEFYEAVIYSHARLTYNQVQDYLDDGTALPTEEEDAQAVERSIQHLADLYRALATARAKRGALELETQEAALKIDKGRVVGLTPIKRKMAHQLIEEAMIAANVCAALHLEAAQMPSLYRVHEVPDPDKLEELRQALSYVGVRLAGGVLNPKTLRQALDDLPATVNKRLYGQLALRSLKQAVYKPGNEGHFGLALERYMHFTSPIRRYPDLVVHRAIKATLGSKDARRKQPSFDALVSLGAYCSQNERRAEAAGWLVDGWLKCDYLSDRVGDTFDGMIAGVTEFGLFVELDGYFVQGLVHISNLGQDYFEYNARALALVGERSGRRFVLGDKLRVTIVDIDAPKGRIDLRLVEGGGRQDQGGDAGSRWRAADNANDGKAKNSGKAHPDRKGDRKKGGAKKKSGKKSRGKKGKRV